MATIKKGNFDIKRMMTKEVRFFLEVGGVYLVFIKWGMLQDKLSKYHYDCNGVNIKFNSFFLLNLLMAFAAFITASFVELYSTKGPNIPLLKFLKPSVTCALASPLSYFAISNKLIRLLTIITIITINIINYLLTLLLVIH